MVDILRIQRRTVRYELADGVRDFQSAMWILVIGFYGWLMWDMPQVWLPAMVDLMDWQGELFGWILILTFGLGIPIILIEGSLRLMNEYVRRRWLWRETGFIKPKRMIVPRPTLFIAFAIMIVTFVGGIFLAIQLEDPWIIFRSIFVGSGFEMAFMYFSLGGQFEIKRYRMVALGGLIGTLALAPLSVSVGLHALMICAFWTVILLVSGVSGLLEVANQQREVGNGA